MVRKEGYSMLIQSLRGEVLSHEPMDRHTAYRIGGPADLLIWPDDREDLRTVLRCLNEYDLSGLFFGKGSNLLVSDRGVNGVVVRLPRFCQGIHFEGNKVHVGSAVSLRRLVDEGQARNLGGIEFLTGIPGTVGGALEMNAGAFGGQIGDCVDSVEVMTLEGEVRWLSGKDLSFQYRQVSGLEASVILSCCLRLEPSSEKRISDERKRLWQLRKTSQPLGQPSCGSVFKRSPGIASPGELIDRAGCKGLRKGNAEVSVMHANFIVNLGRAKADDVWRLIQEVRRRVYDQFGLELCLEVELVGQFE